MIDAKDTLGWCFTLGSMSLGVFGFAYSNYASAVMMHPPGKAPAIVKSLRWFCRWLTVSLLAISCITSFSAYQSCATAGAWALVCILVATTVFCAWLTLNMRH
ncbi:hypothetical protein PQR34_25880 [Paraburkholderia sediminicola]|uniref:hypothetical protein n=1 Tax=Paraburkholderia sediminicola TaxID=458836 RepID=UPI0038BDFC3A